MALTDRQKEIKGLLEQGKKADEIAKKLKITPNAVYQQIRRMRNAGTNVKGTGTQARNVRRKSGRKSPAKARPAVATGNSGAQPVAGLAQAAAPTTPLQAIRMRRQAIEADIKAADASFKDATAEAEKRKLALDKLQERHGGELKNLDAAEAAVKGERPKAAVKPKAKSKGKGSKSGQKAAATPAAAPKAPPAPVPAAPDSTAPAPASGNGGSPAKAPEPQAG